MNLKKSLLMVLMTVTVKLYALKAVEIPAAHTPIKMNLISQQFVCGYTGVMPKPILANCTEPLVKEAVDLRGLWQDKTNGRLERIEQCGNRVVITSKGVIHDLYVQGFQNIAVFDVQVQKLPECQVLAAFAAFSDHKSLKFYVPLSSDLPSKLVVSRTLVDPNTLELIYQGEKTSYTRVKTKVKNSLNTSTS